VLCIVESGESDSEDGGRNQAKREPVPALEDAPGGPGGGQEEEVERVLSHRRVDAVACLLCQP
jgi:hypothetical protein